MSGSGRATAGGPALWLRISWHALRLTARVTLHHWPWLIVAPLASLVWTLLGGMLGGMGLAGGFLRGFLMAGLLSLVLFAARSIIEQRRMDADQLPRGMGAFFGDVMNVLFAFWIVSLVGSVVPGLVWAALFALGVLPVFEMVALAPVAGFGVFASAWSFVNRDGWPWMVGQLWATLLALGGMAAARALHGVTDALPLPDMAWRAVAMLVDALPTLGLFLAFLYRGVLFLTLDNVAPHARAGRFGGQR